MLSTIAVFLAYAITLFLVIMAILYPVLSIYRAIAGDAQIRKKAMIAIVISLFAGLTLHIMPNSGWHWTIQFGLLAVFSFITLNFHAALRLVPNCPLPAIDKHLLIGTLVTLTLAFMMPGLGMKGAIFIITSQLLGG